MKTVLPRLGEVIEPYRKKPDGPQVTNAELFVLLLLVVFTSIGLGGDVSRHVALPDTLEEPFLAGWHLVLYGGVLMIGTWLGVGAIRKGPSYVGSAGSTVIGFFMLALGGFADAVWHAQFGTESSLEALVSPPHMVVFVGLMVLFAAPISIRWNSENLKLGWIESITVMISIISVLLIINLFTGFSSPLSGGISLSSGYTEPIMGVSDTDYDLARGLSAILWFSAIVSGCLTVVVGRFTLKPGMIFSGFLALSIPPFILGGGYEPDAPVRWFCLAFIIAGIAAELVIVALRKGKIQKNRLPVITGVTMLTLWGSLFVLLSFQNLLAWNVHYTTGGAVIGMLSAMTVAWLGETKIVPSVCESSKGFQN